MLYRFVNVMLVICLLVIAKKHTSDGFNAYGLQKEESYFEQVTLTCILEQTCFYQVNLSRKICEH